VQIKSDYKYRSTAVIETKSKQNTYLYNILGDFNIRHIKHKSTVNASLYTLLIPLKLGKVYFPMMVHDDCNMLEQ
jgi:predicted peptidase